MSSAGGAAVESGFTMETGSHSTAAASGLGIVEDVGSKGATREASIVWAEVSGIASAGVKNIGTGACSCIGNLDAVGRVGNEGLLIGT